MKPMEPMSGMKPMSPMKPMEPMKAPGRWWPEELGETAQLNRRLDIALAAIDRKAMLIAKKCVAQRTSSALLTSFFRSFSH
jgi:hypothetical protein